MADELATLADGLKLHLGGDVSAAERIYRQVLADDSGKPDAWYLLGRACQALGNLNEAEANLRRALTLRPAFAEAHASLGIVLKGLGRIGEAVPCYREAIRLRPNYLEAHNNLGNALDQLGRHGEAVECFERIIRQRPDYAEAHNNLGMVKKGQRAWDQAAACLRNAIRIQPDFAEAHYNLGVVLTELRDDDGALACYERALALKPDFDAALYGWGHLVASRGNHDLAEAIYRRGIEIRPGSPELWGGLGFVLAEQGLLSEGLDAYRQAIRLNPDSASHWSNYLYHLNYDPAVDPASLLDEHRRGAESLGRQPSILRLAGQEPVEGRSLRLGYVSPDLRRHAVASFLEPILANHDRRRFEVFCYSDVGSPDATTARLRSIGHHWREIRHFSDREVDELVRRDRIDILVDLAGHTARNRLGVFARKPAPVQVTYLGYPGTTGLTAIDALLTDTVIDPPARPSWTTETPVRLPGVFCCYAPPDDAGERSPLPALTAGFPTFGSLHKVPKLNTKVIELWSGLLRSVPDARLVLVRDRLKGKRGGEIKSEFEARGVAPGRVEIVHDWSASTHWQHYRSIDIMLDVFPWCGHTTACESLWMGVPIVTLIGDRRSSRMTASVLTALGLTDLIAVTPEQYIEVASRWIGDLNGLARWRCDARDLMRDSPLCDGLTFTRNLEAAYESLWGRQ